MKLKLLITIEIETSEFFEPDDRAAEGWFYEDVLSIEDKNLALNSKALGDAIGEVIGCEVVK